MFQIASCHAVRFDHTYRQTHTHTHTLTHTHTHTHTQAPAHTHTHTQALNIQAIPTCTNFEKGYCFTYSLGARPFLATLFTTPPDELAQLLENSSATTLSLAPGGGTLMKPFTPPGDLISRISRAPMTPSRDFPTNVSCAPFSLQRTLSRELV